MLPDDPRHGTTRGHAAGCRDQCCRDARNADERRRRKHREVFGTQRRIDGIGTRRRIQALWAIGWTSQHITEACGWGTPQAVTEVVAVRRAVFASTAETVARVYEQMSMTPGPSIKNRREASRKGWLPPLAWDNIDNPSVTPNLAAADGDDLDPVVVDRILSGDFRLTATPAERREVMARWTGSLNELERVTGWNVHRERKREAA